MVAQIDRYVLFSVLLVLGTCSSLFSAPVALIGEIFEFNGPDALDLDPAKVVVAIDCFGDQDRMVNGVLFQTDKTAPPNVSVVATRSINNWATRPSYSGSDQASVDNFGEIMRDIRWELAPGGLEFSVSGLETGRDYEVLMLFNEGREANRSWDIGIEGVLAADDFSSEGEGTWSASNGFAYKAPFTLTDGDTTLNVEMRSNLGGQFPSGSDNNPLIQAFIVSEVFFAPTPDALTLDRLGFFENQTLLVGTFTTVDVEEEVNHLYDLTVGFGDNDKFAVDDDQLILDPNYDFSQHVEGTTFLIQVRTTDAERPERFLLQDFTLTLQSPLAPTAVSINSSSVGVDTIVGTILGQFEVVDANAFDDHTYALIGGVDQSFLTIEGDNLRLANPIPVDRTSLSFVVRATDLSGLSVDSLLTLVVTESSFRLNEVMPGNATVLADENGDFSDWVEIVNDQSGASSLEGWYLTDDPNQLTKWRFPGVSLTGNEYLVVFASGKDRAPVNGDELHASFNLSGGGGFLALVKPDGMTIASQFDYPETYSDVSYGLNAAGTELGFLQVTSPGMPNGDTAAQVVNTVTFSQERGVYQENFELTLTAAISGSVIRYTTNGVAPTPNTGTIYSGPFMVSPNTTASTRGTRRIRAIALNPAAAISPVETHTYVWVDGVGNPETTGVLGQSVFEESITDHPIYGPLMSESLKALPVVSITKPSGIGATEEITSIELLSHDGSEPGFHVDCGIKVVGGDSVNSPKNNFRLYFRGIYGDSKLRYPVFKNHPYTEGASEEFDVLQLRSGSHDNFFFMALPGLPSILPRAWDGGGAQYVRNRWISDAQMLMGKTSLHGRFVHCYLNGTYHGLYQLHERPMHNYMDKYFGGDQEDYHYTNATKSGSDHGSGWQNTWNQVKLAAQAGGEQSKRWINWESLADYQLLTYYCGNTWDWKPAQNWMAAGPVGPDQGGWRFYCWDQDVMLYDPAANNLTGESRFNAPDGVFQALMQDEDFRVYFSDRVYKHCFHDGFLTPGPLQQSHDYRMNEIKEAVIAETARWQPDINNPRDPGAVGLEFPWDRDQEWMAEWDFVRDIFWPQRAPILIQQLRNRGWYPLDAPEFVPNGGEVMAGLSPGVIAPEGTIYVTTDGSDPRMPGGVVNPNAQILSAASSTVALPRESQWKYLDDGSDQGTAWRAPGFDDSSWASGQAELGYGDGIAGAEGQVIEFGDALDKHITTYFRKQFTVNGAADIIGMVMKLRRDDGAVIYLNGDEVWRSGMRDDEVVHFESTAKETVGGSEESEFQIKTDVPPSLLLDGVNTIAVEVHQVSPTSSDLSFDFELCTQAPSDPSQLVINESMQVNARVKVGNNWSAINELRFAVGEPADAVNLVVSEFSYRPAKASVEEDPGGIFSRTDFEFIELKNISSGPIHLDGVNFSDGVNFDFSTLPRFGLEAGASFLIVENKDAFMARYPDVPVDRIVGEYSGQLSNDGERIELLAADGSIIRDFTYNDQVPWPVASDGDGYSLELIVPDANPDHAIAQNWRASLGIGGSPAGDFSTMSFAAWRAANFDASELADVSISGANADPDRDGWSNYAEFALGLAPKDAVSRGFLPEANFIEIGEETYLTFTFREWAGAQNVDYRVEVSDDLDFWDHEVTAIQEIGAPIDFGDGTTSRTFQVVAPVSASPRKFVRLRVMEGP